MKNKKSTLIYLLIIIIITIFVNIRLPYFISAPGGVININERIESKNNNGSLNMLYVKEYEGTPATLLMSLFHKNYDVYKIDKIKISNETNKELKERNKLMLNNSINNAIYVAYKEIGEKLKIKDIQNIVIATSKDNGLSVGDIILKCDGKDVQNINDLKEIIENKTPHEFVNLLVKREDITMDLNVEVNEEHLIGVAIITNYEFDDEIDIKFKNSEGGASGGLMLSLAIYQEISGKDLMKGRKIAGTGTIDINGNVGPIDGIKYKIMGANKNKIDIIFVPEENYQEASKIIENNNYQMKLYKVKTLEDAINYLIN